MESMWNINIPWNLNGFHVEYVGFIWNTNIPWILCGFQVNSIWNLHKIHGIFLCGFHVDSMSIPCRFHVDSMSIPNRFQVEHSSNSKLIPSQVYNFNLIQKFGSIGHIAGVFYYSVKIFKFKVIFFFSIILLFLQKPICIIKQHDMQIPIEVGLCHSL
jgi:hypothetical protein